MVTFEVEGKSFYVDNRLARDLDKVAVGSLKKKDKDWLVIVDGKERSGKSVFSQTLAAYMCHRLNSKFDVSNVCMTPNEFKKKVQSANKNEIIIYDEAHRGMGSSSSLSEVNKILTDLMMEMGQRNLFIIVVLPTFFMLTKYVALFRAKGLFHIYEKKNARGFWCYFNEKYKKPLYFKGKKYLDYNCMKWPRYRGRFYNQYLIEEQAYRDKKGSSFKQKDYSFLMERMQQQRNALVSLVYNELDLSLRETSILFEQYHIKMKKDVISKIINTKIDGHD